jgi:hypothetical protein
MNKTITFVLIVITCTCYSQQDEIDKVMRKCVNQNTSDYHLSTYNQKFKSFYSIMEECESTMIKEDVLKGNTKKDYFEFIKSLSSETKISEYREALESVHSIFEENRYDISAHVLSHYPISFCPVKAYESLILGEESLVFKQLQMKDNIWANGAKDLEPVKTFINQLGEEQFNNQTYKAVIQLFILNYWKGRSIQ